MATLSLVALLRCNVYNDSLLGQNALTVGGTGTGGHSGSSGGAPVAAGRPGLAGGSEAGGAANVGGFAEMAGAIETGGAEPGGGTGGTVTGGGGSGGNGGSGGSVAGSSGTAGSGGTTPIATGCAKLSVPLDDAADKAHFVIGLASAADFSGATVSMRFYVQAGQGGTIFNYVQDSGTFHFLGVPAANRQPLSSANGWTTITWKVGDEPDTDGTGIVKTSIKSVGIEINAQPSTTWSNATVVYVDSLTVQSPAFSFTFDGSSSVSTSNTNGALWLNSNTADTTASGAAVTWQDSCP